MKKTDSSITFVPTQNHCGRWRGALAMIALGVVALLATASGAGAQWQFTTMHHFNRADGFGPMAGVIEGADGALYGTTALGGSADLGTVFRLDRATFGFTSLRQFSGADGSTVYSGVALGADGLLYGSTYAGGVANLGTLFRIAPGGGSFATLYNFNGADGSNPDDLRMVQAADGAFYSVTSAGGSTGGGTLFRLDPATLALTTALEFNPDGGAGVDAGLVAGRDGYWYGTTYSGGANGVGSVFRVDPATLAVTTLHDFSSADGANPLPGALMQGSDGNLYGTTQMGSGGYGTVYRLNPLTLAFATLHSFSGVNDGRSPLGGVTDGGDGNLYGTTALGGAGYGTVFRVNPTTGAYGIVVWFGGSNGRMPSGNLLRASDGALYGTTRVGGNFNDGTVFRLAPPDVAPPVIASVTASPGVLSPAKGQMVPVTITVSAADNLDPAPKSRIIGVTCNQPASGDWTITGDLTVSLRAQRNKGATRIYTITVQCTDASGNSSTGAVTVTVLK